MSGIFEDSIFGWNVGYGGLGEVPEGAAELSRLSAYQRSYSLPSEETLRAKGATHFTARQGSDGLHLTFFTDDGREVTSLIAAAQGTERPAPATSKRDLPARREGDGLLPSATAEPERGGVPWVPRAVVGGGLVVAGGLVLLLTRR